MNKNTIRNGSLLSLGVLLGSLFMLVYYSSLEADAEKKLGSVNASLKSLRFNLAIEKEKNAQLNDVISNNIRDVESAKVGSEEIESEKNAEIDSIESENILQKEQWAILTTAYKKNLSVLTKDVENLKVRLQDADILYAERYRLSQFLNELNSRILKSSHKIDLSKKACEEFKQGNSWNRVTQKDCKTHDSLMQENNAMIDEFDGTSSKLDKINRQLFALGIIKKS